MKIKEQNKQRMVMVPTLSQQLAWIWVLAVSTLAAFSAVTFTPVSVFTPFLVISIVSALHILGELIHHRVVIDKHTENIVVGKRHFLLIHKQRVIPFLAVLSVGLERTKNKWYQYLTRGTVFDWESDEAYRAYINIGDEAVEIAQTSKEWDMRRLASEISSFMGKEFVDRVPITRPPLKGGGDTHSEYPSPDHHRLV